MSNTPVIHMTSGGQQAPALQRGRLIFALDATASRGPTWDIARDLQAKMFRESAPVGKLDVQLVFYRGDECRASRWVSSGDELTVLMNKIKCIGGVTQIARVLKHVLREHEKAPVQALTFIGDAIDGDSIDGYPFDEFTGLPAQLGLADLAGQLGATGVPIYTFQEGRDPAVQKAFRLMALRSGGEYFEFNPDKPQAIDMLAEQLSAVARLAVGDALAIEHLKGK